MTQESRVEQHFIPETHPFAKWAMKEMVLAAHVWNEANTIYRAVWDKKPELIPDYADLIREDGRIFAYDIIVRMRKLKNPALYAMTKKGSGAQVVILLEQAWRAYKSSLSSYSKDKSKFRRCPQPPKNKEEGEFCSVIYAGKDFVLKPGGKIFIKRGFAAPIRTKQEKVQQVQITPTVGGICVNVIYNKEIEEREADTERVLGIDLGLNNLATCVTNVDAPSFLINGRPLKSTNQFFNKRKAKLQSQLAHSKQKSSKRLRRLWRKRNNKIKDYVHKATRRIVDYMVEHNIGKVIVGHNDGWKNEANMGRRNNQNFVNIPHTGFIQLLKYKVEGIGGELVEINESHTSKCSFLDNEKICHHDEYMGKRVKRGLFISSKGIALNADVNGALNILRRGLGCTFIPDNSIFAPTAMLTEKKPLSGNIGGRGAGLVPDITCTIEVESSSPLLDTVI